MTEVLIKALLSMKSVREMRRSRDRAGKEAGRPGEDVTESSPGQPAGQQPCVWWGRGWLPRCQGLLGVCLWRKIDRFRSYK